MFLDLMEHASEIMWNKELNIRDKEDKLDDILEKVDGLRFRRKTSEGEPMISSREYHTLISVIHCFKSNLILEKQIKSK